MQRSKGLQEQVWALLPLQLEQEPEEIRARMLYTMIWDA